MYLLDIFFSYVQYFHCNYVISVSCTAGVKLPGFLHAFCHKVATLEGRNVMETRDRTAL